MHIEILNDKQQALLPLISQFQREYYLVGGTAIALHIGHRRSIDFDLFKRNRINHKRNVDKIQSFGFPMQITRRVEEQMNLIVNDVKLTFFEYPFDISATDKVESFARTPSLLDLGAMKALPLPVVIFRRCRLQRDRGLSYPRRSNKRRNQEVPL